MEIKKQLVILFFILMVLAIFNYFVISYFADRPEIIRNKAETAHQLVKHFNTLQQHVEQVNATNESAKKGLQKNTRQVSQILDVFLNGGKLPNYQTYTDEASGHKLQDLKAIKSLWDSVEHNINTLRFDPYTIDTTVQETIEVPTGDTLNPTRTEVTSKIMTIDNPDIVKARSFSADRLQVLEEQATDFHQKLIIDKENADALVNIIILIVVLFNLAVMGAILLGIRKIVLSQVKSLEQISKALSRGNFDVAKNNFEWKNELSEVAHNLNVLAENLNNATEFVKNIGSNKLDAEFKGIDTENVSESSLQGALIDMRDKMKQVDEEEKIRKWSTTGLTKFVDILRSSDENVAQLSDRIISNLVEYTHSLLGGLYLLSDAEEGQDTEQRIELISLYAYDTKKFETRSYRLGEGLVGQTFVEKKTTYLLEIPDNYIKIVTGLGETNPKAILVVPLMVNEEIFGIIELASLQPYEDYEIEFVEKLGENIASTIANVKNNQRNKRLLEESQELTEQMQAQEEEMRQNMEELSATQEEMARKEIELTAQLTAINNTIGTVEYDIDALIVNVNSIFAENLEYDTEELLDQTFASIYEGDEDIWSKIKMGEKLVGSFKFKKKSGEEIMLKSSFTPITNKDGEVHKIIQLVTQFGEETTHGEADKSLHEVESALRQNLEELEITQEQLDAKIKYVEEKMHAVDAHVKILLIDHELNVMETNPAAKDFFDKDVKGLSVEEVFDDKFAEAVKSKKTNTICKLKEQSKQSMQSLDMFFAYSEKEKTYALWL
ncbi:MAG: GAF domain-containing protein [Fulvivirga sp.]|nr:GAF domain-containing protein [Fulvivirga sp.]